MELSSFSIGLDQVRLALNAANANVPKGSLSDSGRTWVITDNDQIFKAPITASWL